MTNVQLHDLRKRGDEAGGLVVQPMPGVAFDAMAPRAERGPPDTLELGLGPARLARRDRLAPCPGVQLDDRRSDRFRCVDGLKRRLDEERDADAGPAELAHERDEVIVPTDDVEPTLGRALRAPLGHEAG